MSESWRQQRAQDTGASVPPQEPRRWFVAHVLRSFGIRQAGSAIGLLAATALSLLDPLILGWLVDRGLASRGPGLPAALVAAVALFLALQLARAGINAAATLAIWRAAQRVIARLRVRLFMRLQGLDAGFFDAHPLGDLLLRLEQDVEQVTMTASELVPLIARLALSVVLTVSIMLVIDSRLCLVIAPFIVALLLLRRRFGPTLATGADAVRLAGGERSGFLGDCLSHLTEIQLLGGGRAVRRTYAAHAIRASRESGRQRIVEMAYAALSLTTLMSAAAVMLLAGAAEVRHGRLTVGAYVAFYSYLMRLYDPLSGATDAYTRLQRAGSSVRRLMELDQAAPMLADAVGPRPASPAGAHLLRLDSVAFHFAAKGPVLRDATLTIDGGERVALLGRSGSGKSTLARLLVRSYDPERGTVELAGHDVRELERGAISDLITIVPRTPFVIPGTLRENALLGARSTDAERLGRIASLVRFDEVVATRPDGWNQRIGARGTGLSDGERQRLGLVRALLRDRPVLVLDEATSALDPVIEGDVLRGIGEWARAKAVLIITHRLTTACWAHRVVVLSDGCLMPRSVPTAAAGSAGSADELLWGVAELDLSSPDDLPEMTRVERAARARPMAGVVDG